MTSIEPTHYLRALRLRWKLLVLAFVAGGLIGYASTLLAEEDEGPVVTYWAAKHSVVVNLDDAARFPNLPNLALRVTGGTIPETVAAELGGDPEKLAASTRTITLNDVSAIEISSVALDAVEARQVADAFATALVALVAADDLAAYEERVEALDTKIDDRRAEAEDFERDRDEVARELELLGFDERGRLLDPAAAGAVPADVSVSGLVNTYALLSAQTENRYAELERTLIERDELVREGPPAPVLESLDKVPSYTISEGEYRARLKQGRRGENNFTNRDQISGGGGSAALGDRLANPVLRAVLGSLAALLTAIGAVTLHLRFDPRLRSKHEVAEIFGAPVVAEIPRFAKRAKDQPQLHAREQDRSFVTEAFRMVRSALLFSQAAAEGASSSESGGAEARVVMVTSPGPSEGKTTTTANLAIVLAEAGYEVLVINCDYRRPKLHELFGVEHQPRRAISTDVPGVTLVADVAGGPDDNPTDIVRHQRALIARARERYDVVLLDTAPLLATNDAAAVLPAVDLVLLVAREGQTSREAAEETRELLRRRRANVAGVVLTDAVGFGGSRYYYKYRYGNYYWGTEDQPAAQKAARPKRRKSSRTPKARKGRSARRDPKRQGGDRSDRRLVRS